MEAAVCRFSCGDHDVSIRAYYPAPLDGSAGFSVAVNSTPITVNVANDIRYPNWLDQADQAVKVDLKVPSSLLDYAIWFFRAPWGFWA